MGLLYEIKKWYQNSSALCSVDENIAYPNEFVLSTGAVSNQEGTRLLVVDSNAPYVMDQGYINYSDYKKWIEDKIQNERSLKWCHFRCYFSHV